MSRPGRYNIAIVRQLRYQQDSAALVQALSRLPGLVFLDSSGSTQSEGRYDIISAMPTERLLLPTAAAAEGGHECIFAATDAALQRHAPESTQTHPELADLPFTGGAIGYFAYDANIGLPGAPPPKSGHIQAPTAQIGIFHWAIVVDHHEQRSVFFILAECPAQIREKATAAVLAADNLANASTPPLTTEPSHPKPFALNAPFKALSSKQSYQNAFARLQAWIAAGDCYQANLAQCFQTQWQGDPLQAYQHLRSVAKAPFSAYLTLDQGAVLSFSPERFIRLDKGRVTTQPIKGTRKRGQTPQEDEALRQALMNSEKDRAENLMIVDLLRNDLGTICETGSVQTEKLFELVSFSNVHHLISTVSGRLPANKSALKLLRNCFPGGSITGAPKIRAMQIIDALEPVPRSVYCGVIAYIGFDGRMDTNIAIRTLLCDNVGELYCWGGGGIVADSICEQEYQESIDKISIFINELEENFLIISNP